MLSLMTVVGGGKIIIRSVRMELFISVLGLLVGMIGVYFGYENYKKDKNTDC